MKKYSAIATMDSFKNRTNFEKTNSFFGGSVEFKKKNSVKIREKNYIRAMRFECVGRITLV